MNVYKAFQEAARMIAEGEEEYSCLALRTALGAYDPEVVGAHLYTVPSIMSYLELMRPENDDLPYWGKDPAQSLGARLQIAFMHSGPEVLRAASFRDTQDCRVLALLFASEVLYGRE